jgi:hypothetical protein
MMLAVEHTANPMLRHPGAGRNPRLFNAISVSRLTRGNGCMSPAGHVQVDLDVPAGGADR